LFSLKAGRKNKKTMGIHVLYLLLAYQATPAAQSSGLRRPSFKWTSTGFSAGKCRSQLAVPDLGFAAKTPLRCQNPVRIENIDITATLASWETMTFFSLVAHSWTEIPDCEMS
jgi:hypothetical protein